MPDINAIRDRAAQLLKLRQLRERACLLIANRSPPETVGIVEVPLDSRSDNVPVQTTIISDTVDPVSQVSLPSQESVTPVAPVSPVPQPIHVVVDTQQIADAMERLVSSSLSQMTGLGDRLASLTEGLVSQTHTESDSVRANQANTLRDVLASAQQPPPPVINVEAPSVTIKPPRQVLKLDRTKRSFRITHSDGSISIVEEL